MQAPVRSEAPSRAAHPPHPVGGAVLDESGTYRYRLWRRWGTGAPLLFILLNPSTADAADDDPTLRRCVGFARRWGFDGVEIVNVFGLRATDPSRLRTAADPVGPENDRHIRRAARAAGLVMAGWGNGGTFGGRAGALARLLDGRRPLHCLGRTASGQPKHPLYVRADAPVLTWP